MKKPGKSPILNQAFKEVFNKPPKVAKATGRKQGAAAMRKQQIAIAFSKSRAAGGPG